MPTKVTVVPALPSDAAAIASLGRRTFIATFSSHTSPDAMRTYLDQVYTPEHMASALDTATTSNQFFVARVDGGDGDDRGHGNNDGNKIAGFVQMRTGVDAPEACQPRGDGDGGDGGGGGVIAPSVELHRIYVDLDFIGSGVGKALLEHGVRWAAERMLGPGTDTAVAVEEEEEEKKETNGEEGEKGKEHQQQQQQQQQQQKRKMSGRAFVWLGVYSEQPSAQRFYRRRGFEKVGEKLFDVAGQTDIDWVMVRWIQ